MHAKISWQKVPTTPFPFKTLDSHIHNPNTKLVFPVSFVHTLLFQSCFFSQSFCMRHRMFMWVTLLAWIVHAKIYVLNFSEEVVIESI